MSPSVDVNQPPTTDHRPPPFRLTFLALLVGAGLAALMPGSPRACHVLLGASLVVLALWGVAWAARRDGWEALGLSPSIRRGTAPLCPSRSLARAGRCFAGFCLLTLMIQVPLVQSFDAALVRQWYLRGGPDVTTVMTGISHAGGGSLAQFGIPLLMAALWLAGQARSLRFFAASLLGIVGLQILFKPLVHRARPEVVPGEFFNSYPSGHALAATILAGVLLLLLLPRCRHRALRLALWALAVVWIALTAIARVYLGNHFPTDVIAGVFLGAAWVYACHAWSLRSMLAASAASPEPRAGHARPCAQRLNGPRMMTGSAGDADAENALSESALLRRV